MSDAPIKRPAIPSEAGVKDWESLRRFLAPVKTLLEIHEGWRGRPGIDRFVPEGELGKYARSDISLEEVLSGDTYPPAPPTNMVVTPGVWANRISWVNPTDDDLSHIEIWCHTANAVSEAALVGVVTVPRTERGAAAQFSHMPENLTADHYYWIRSVDYSGNYSTWVPTEAQGGALVEGIDTYGETIDQVMTILKGGAGEYAAYNPATTYVAGQRVTYNGRAYQCVVASVTGIAPDSVSPPGKNYWTRVGIVIEGEVDGVNTVGVDGSLVVDGSVMARAIYGDTLSAIRADMGTLTAGSIVIGDLNKLWLNHAGDGGLAIGGTNKATAPFRVSATGKLTIIGAIAQSPSGTSAPVPCMAGVYASGTTYYRGDVVSYNGSSWMYVNTSPSAGNDPADNEFWDVFAQGGTAAQYVTVLGEQVFKYENGATVPVPAAIVLTAILTGSPTPYRWEWKNPSTNTWMGLSGTNNQLTYTLAHNNSEWGEANALQVRYKAANCWDSMTIIKVYDGLDGPGVEFIFKRTATQSTPTTPGTSQVDDYVPAGWTDNQSGVTEAYPFEWVCKRTRADGVWSGFSTPKLWATFSDHGYTVVLTNETHTIACAADGKVNAGELGSSGRAASDIIVYKKTDRLTGVSSSTPGTGEFNYSASVSGCSVTMRDYDSFYLTGVSADTGYVDLTIKCESSATVITKRFTWSKSKAGSAGVNGADGPGLTFRGNWTTGVSYVGTADLRDVVYREDDDTYYRCITSHTAGASFAPSNWLAFGASFESVATNILLAQDVTITKKLTFTGSSSAINVTGASGLTVNAAGGVEVKSLSGITISSGGGLTVNSGGGITVSGGGNIVLASGGDISLYGHPTDPSQVNFYDPSSNLIACMRSIGSYQLQVWPMITGTRYLQIGANTCKFLDVDIMATNEVWLVAGSSTRQYIFGNLGVYTYDTNVSSLGLASNLWKEVWATDGTINTSDETEKDGIEDSDLGLSFLRQLSPRKWVWKWGKRPHYGLISQEVGDVLARRGHDFAGYIRADGEKTSHHLRYHEFIGPIIKAIQEMDARVSALETT